MNDRMKDLAIRSLSGAILLAIFFGAILWSRWSFGVLSAVILVGCQWEFYCLCRANGAEPKVFTGLICGFALLAVNFIIFEQFGRGTADYTIGTAVSILLLFILLLIPVVFISELAGRSGNPIANISSTFTGVVYVAVPVSLLLYIPLLLDGGVWNGWTMLGFVFIVWANDVFAYLVGCTIGRHRMCERISPKKSWEGFVGGVLGAVAVALAIGYFRGGNLLVWGGLGVITALTGVAGDFVESMFKRSVGVKDSGKMLPGHGGWLDRFDAMLLSVPFVFVYLIIVCNQ